MTDISQLGKNAVAALDRLHDVVDIADVKVSKALMELSIAIGQLVAVSTGESVEITTVKPREPVEEEEEAPPKYPSTQAIFGAAMQPGEQSTPVMCGVLKRFDGLVCGCGTICIYRGDGLAYCAECSHFCGLSMMNNERMDLSDDRFLDMCPRCSDGECAAGMMRSVKGGQLDKPCPNCNWEGAPA